jgi:competence protein ComEC
MAILFSTAAFFFLHTLRFIESPARQLSLEFKTARTVNIDGIVWDEPRSLPMGESTFLVKATIVGETIRDAGLVRVRTAGEQPACGDRVQIRGLGQTPRPPRNPAEFDQAKWSERQGISLELRCEAAQDSNIVARAEGRQLMRLAAHGRVWIREHLAKGVELSVDEVALVESMVLGVNAETPPEMRDLFQKTGTLHLLAVSGLNVAMLAAIILSLLRPFRLNRVLSATITILALVGYAVLTGLSPSCTRATIMGAFIIAAPCFDRSAVLLNSLAAAAFFLLACDTNQFFSVGFQLSFGIVLVIFYVANRVKEKVAPLTDPDELIPRELWTPFQRFRVELWRLFAAAVGVNIASWAGSLLFMAGYFHVISPAAILANFIAVGLAFCVLALGLASVISAAAPPVALLFNNANVVCAGMLLAVVTGFAKIPGGYFYVEIPQHGPTLAAELTVLDMGEGAATHIRAGSIDWLVDAGHARDYTRTLVPYLRSRGVNTLDALLLTHGDVWHIGGAAGLMHEFHPTNWIEGRPADRSPTRRALHAALAQNQIGRDLCVAGDVWKLSPDAEVRILFPPAGLEKTLADDQALVLLITTANRRILLMSDAGFSTEQWLLSHLPGLHADVIVKGWHDRDPAGDTSFIEQIAPSLVVASEGEYGKTAEEMESWAQPLREKGIAVFLQSTTGAVRITVAKSGALEAISHIPGTPRFSLP